MNKEIHPREIFVAKTADKVFSVSAFFKPSDVEKGYDPMKIYQPGLSRFVFSIVNLAENTFPKGNIKMEEIPHLIAQTKAAHQIDVFAGLPVLHQLFFGIKELNRMVSALQEGVRMVYRYMRTKQVSQASKPSVQEKASLAKTVLIGNGKLKGKTPYQVLAEDPQALVDLESQYKWLNKNLDRYPANKQQMDAIEEAIELFKVGKITDGDDVEKLTFGIIPLYKPTPRPLMHKKGEDGLVPVYEVGINWHVGDKNPVEVSVKQYKTVVKENANGTLNPQRAEAVEVEINTMRLNATQWMQCIYMMEANMSRFEFLMASKQFKEAEDAEYASILASRK